MKALRLLAPLLALLASPAAQAQQPSAADPEAASGIEAKALVHASRQMVVAANPHAARAGLDILRKGGSALDAAIAAQMVLNLVEPQSSGIGGGAFLLHWDGKDVTSFDGRETAPAAARPDRFLGPDNQAMKYREAVKSGRSIGVPGLLRMLEMAHAQHGALPWADLFAPAIELAESGFPVSPRLARLLDWAGADSFSADGRALYFDGEGKARPAGYLLHNPALAATLRRVAIEGAKVLHEGELAGAIVAAVNAAPHSAGDMTAGDIAAYRALARPPLCVNYRVWKICGMGPPSSGGSTVAATLKMLEAQDLGHEPLAAAALHLIAEAEKLAYADRDRYVADPDFVPVPSGLTETAYLAERAMGIDPERAMQKARPGKPPGAKEGAFGADATLESAGTSHISVVDAQGRAAAMTTTIESGFGSGIMVGGFLLNNELTDFSFQPVSKDGRPVANRVEGGKRSRSSMSPTLVFDADGRLRMVTGSPGGSRIILYVVKTLIAHLDWGLDAQASAALANFGSRNGPFEIETGSAAGISAALAAKGHEVRELPMTSGTHSIVVTRQGLQGGADPRREGVALGD
ncbi:MAG: gamma-glutamyltransferase [Pseudomonadota bacterium]|nr:gamma-glutamyltransferase [Pseudomonadota bacterium]